MHISFYLFATPLNSEFSINMKLAHENESEYVCDFSFLPHQ